MAVQVHAASLFCFLLLLIVQTLAIRYRAISTHRILGRFSNIVIPTALIFSVAILWKKYHKHLTDGATVATARNAEFLSAAQLLLFVALYAVSIAAIGRRDVATHMRCMICIALVLLPTGMARVLGYLIHVRQAPSQTVWLALIDALLLALIVFDWTAAWQHALTFWRSSLRGDRDFLAHTRATHLGGTKFIKSR